MTRARLEGMPLPLLQELSFKEGLDLEPDSDKDDLVEALWDIYEEDRREKEQLYNLITRIEEAKFAFFETEKRPVNDASKEIILPDTYDETVISMVLRDPNWAFIYWDVKSALYQELEKEYGFKGLTLRVIDSPRPHLSATDQNSYFTITLTSAYGSQYINLPEQDCYYMVELRGQLLEKESRLLSRSKFIYVPADGHPYTLASGKEGEAQKKILELSGFSKCEPLRGKPEVDQTRRIPQRIGDMDDL